MIYTHNKWTNPLALQGMLLVVVALGVNLPLHASPPEKDLSDNEICLDCHIDEEQLNLLEVAGPQVHNPADSTLIEESHAELACIDCHQDIQDVPHRDEIERTVDCLACHESTPE
jgi:nitrate/TMAO reductase-like tetraheme cytochrome c subunit